MRLKLQHSNPKVSRLYCLPKIHKPTLEMRALVSGIDSPTEKLARWLNKKICFFAPPEGFSVQNSSSLVSGLSNAEFSNSEIVVCFEVKALFPSIPIPKRLDILKSWLVSH